MWCCRLEMVRYSSTIYSPFVLMLMNQIPDTQLNIKRWTSTIDYHIYRQSFSLPTKFLSSDKVSTSTLHTAHWLVEEQKQKMLNKHTHTRTHHKFTIAITITITFFFYIRQSGKCCAVFFFSYRFRCSSVHFSFYVNYSFHVSAEHFFLNRWDMCCWAESRHF